MTMAIPTAAAAVALLVAFVAPVAYGDPALVAGRKVSENFILEGENLAPWANTLLKFSPEAPAPNARFPLILAARRTRRPDILHKFRLYRGGWDITSKHYWASVGFTGAAGFIFAFLWVVFFGLALGACHCCICQKQVKEKELFCSERICLIFLLIFTCVASTGCILLSVGQDEFHDKVFDTLHFVVNQSDFTVQILRNVTDYLSLAKTVDVGEQFFLPFDAQKRIDNLNKDMNNAADQLSDKTSENSGKIKQAFNAVRSALIVVAAVMLLLALFGFILSVLGYNQAIYVFVLSGWLFVAVTLLLCGVFVIVNNVIGDTHRAMNEWVENPQAETALSSILPCVDGRTTNLTLNQSKDVIRQVVNLVNSAIATIVNSNDMSRGNQHFYNQSGPLMPYLCSPYDLQLNNQACGSQEVSFVNAPMVWQKYICTVSDSGSCMSIGRVTPGIYSQLVLAVNASYALDHYSPLLLSLQDCRFVRETFISITTRYCPKLKRYLQMVNIGLVLISTGVMLCLILWIFYANCPRREQVFVNLSQIRVGNK